jgi:hypothetical protein
MVSSDPPSTDHPQDDGPPATGPNFGMARTDDSGDGRVTGSAAIPAPRPSTSGYIHDALLYDSTDELAAGVDIVSGGGENLAG